MIPALPGPASLPAIGQILLLTLAALAAVFDIRSHRIPNWLVLAGIAAGALWNGYAFGLSGFTRASLGLCLGLILYFPLYLLRARGAGDVKLLMAAGTIAGPGNCFWIFLFTAVFGGAVALVWVLIWGRGSETVSNIAGIMQDLAHFRAPYRGHPELDVTTDKGMRLPHAAMIAIGVLVFILASRNGGLSP